MLSPAFIRGTAQILYPRSKDPTGAFVAACAVADGQNVRATPDESRVLIGQRTYHCRLVDSGDPLTLTEDCLIMHIVGSDVEFLIYRDCVQAVFTGSFIEEARMTWRSER
jgi:hypothetical protein